MKHLEYPDELPEGASVKPFFNSEGDAIIWWEFFLPYENGQCSIIHIDGRGISNGPFGYSHEHFELLDEIRQWCRIQMQEHRKINPRHVQSISGPVIAYCECSCGGQWDWDKELPTSLADLKVHAILGDSQFGSLGRKNVDVIETP